MLSKSITNLTCYIHFICMDVNIRNQDSLDIVDRNIIEYITDTINKNPAFELIVKAKQNDVYQGYSTKFIIKGDLNSDTYMDDPLEMVRNQIHTISDGRVEYHINETSSEKTLSFTIDEFGYYHAKGFIKTIDN